MDHQGLAGGVTAAGLDERVVDAQGLEPGKQEVAETGAGSGPGSPVMVRMVTPGSGWYSEGYHLVPSPSSALLKILHQNPRPRPSVTQLRRPRSRPIHSAGCRPRSGPGEAVRLAWLDGEDDFG